MTIRSVNQSIQKAVKDNRVDSKEVDRILKEVKPSLSNGEAKAIAALHDTVVKNASSPITAPVAQMDPAALAKLEAFIAAKGLPIGDAAVSAYRDGINDVLARVRLGTPVAKPRVENFIQIPLSDLGVQAIGGSNRTAYVDIVKKRFYLSEGPVGADATTKFWGPLSLPKIDVAKPETPSVISETRKNLIMTVWRDIESRGAVDFKPSLPLGVRMASVPLYRERHPDGFAFEVLVPTGALSPTAPQKDPNKVDEFYIRRTGGIAGLTQFAGPFSVKDKPSVVTPHTLQRLTERLDRALDDGELSFKASLNLPAGLGVTTIPLKDDGVADGFTYKALVPSGGFPGQPPVDPNNATRFWIERSGGLLGNVTYAGPIELNDRPIIDAGGAGGTPGIRMPTHAQMLAAYKSIYEGAAAAGRLKQLSGPPVADPSRYPRFDITPPGMMDVNRAIWDIEGKLYLQTSGMGPRGPIAHWSEIGPTPLF
jgi:hypothetical protein